MEVKVQHLGKVRFQASTRGHQVISDQPASNGGLDTGMTPPELLVSALGTCVGYYAAEYLKNHSLPTDGLEVVVAAEKLKNPARLGNFRVEVIAPGMDEANQAGLLRMVKACPIHNTLAHSPEFQFVVSVPAPVST